jgi:RHS repeat-associated protein
MSNVSLQRKTSNFQENPSDLDAQLLELGFLCEKDDAMQMIFYTGKEKNEESSLYYCEQRYYAAHVSRWVSTGPTWLADGINIYAYVHGNPVSGADPHGTNEENVVDQEQRNVNQVSISKKNRDSDEENNIPTDGPHSISDEMIQIINKVGWHGGGLFVLIWLLQQQKLLLP